MTNQNSAPIQSSAIGALTSHSILLMLGLTAGTAWAQQSAPPNETSSQEAPKAESASRGPRPLIREIRYNDWQKVCFKTPGTNAVCRTTISGTFDTGQSAVRADLIERENENAPRLQLFLPVGLYLQAGVKVSVDQGAPYQIPYVWCLTNTCIAATLADQNLIKQMETGQKLQLEVVDSNMLTISTSIQLQQFARVRNGTPVRVFEQDIDEP
jgi:invasion protein IalB